MASSRGHEGLLDALSAIPVESCDYQTWVDVGMALKQAGFALSDWQAWSASDTRTRRDGRPYYSERETASKWAGFDNQRADRVTSGTIIHLAESFGWRQPSQRQYGWDDKVATSDGPSLQSYSAKLIDARDVGEESFETGEPADAAAELTAWLRALFRHDEHVCIVTRTSDGRPAGRGRFEMTREEVEALVAERGLAALGMSGEGAGAFACVNPLDGEGREDKNVTDFRYALVESDVLPPGKQLALIHEMRLPCAAITWSGGKSVHAVVHIDARDKAQYRERVAELYQHLAKNGFVTDEQNKNPSRLTRCPGFARGSGWQRLIEADVSEFLSWDEWQDWVVQEMTRLPEIEAFGDVAELPPLAEPIIEGVLRRNQKMLVVGPAKAGKSFLMIELAVAVAEGWEWVGHACRRGRALIINFEIQRASMLHRIGYVYDAMARCHEGGARHKGSLHVWNLRGHSAPLDRITPALVRKAQSGGYDLIIIDPIYKVLTGDENSASDMAAFCNEFDVISEELDATVVYCHHHAKGDAGRRAAMDRASGSGVFTRDPDAFLDMSPIAVPADLRPRLAYEDADGYLLEGHPFRVSYTLREFPTPTPTDVIVEWPRHLVTDELSGCRVVGEPKGAREASEAASAKRTKRADARFEAINGLISDAYGSCPRGERFDCAWAWGWLSANRADECRELGVTRENLLKWTANGSSGEARCKWAKGQGGELAPKA